MASMSSSYLTPPHTSPVTPTSPTPHVTTAGPLIVTHLATTNPTLQTCSLTHPELTPGPARLQQDLHLLALFPDNTTLHWRPSWFPPNTSPLGVWTLHNPPNVVTTRLPYLHGRERFTRRPRRPDDPAPLFIKDWKAWETYCGKSGIPVGFLGAAHMELLQVAAEESSRSELRRMHEAEGVLYPEPPVRGSYMLASAACETLLPRKFRKLVEGERVVVDAGGRLRVVVKEEEKDRVGLSRGYRWSCVPWTSDMEEDCQPLTLRLRGWNAER
ncbi:hypothetical protein C7974DRAFT_378537 [Boeremia exigua]|uniref:uncharacterized protein n=1 Tax=Boeremia exigua TaxID=749465 RepID=UPI001E8E0B43|nr:uncharacterized protein C7974DRAFT_378537 [Boeremia exigua]KAH6620500.1 hypothetical protein C7974DRAFT_378537 [Boeremia exigua]